MKPIFIIATWVVFALGNICIAEWNNTVRLKRIANKNPKQIEHFWYALGYCILCGIVFYVSRNYWELASLLLLRSSVFAVAYNKFSDLPAFHLSISTTSWWDRLLRTIGLKSIEEVAIISFCISVTLVMFQLFKL